MLRPFIVCGAAVYVALTTDLVAKASKNIQRYAYEFGRLEAHSY
jgi:hypothetical protein